MVSLSIVITSTVTPLGASNAKSPIRMAQSQRPFVSQSARQPAPKDKGRRVNPTAPQPGAPSVALPSLEQARQRLSEKPKAPVATESTLRSRRKPLESRQVRKVGDPLPARKKVSRINLGDGSERATVADADTRGSVGPVRSHHARTARSLPTGACTIVANNPLSLITSRRGLANHSAFDFLRYPTLHTDTYAASVLEWRRDAKHSTRAGKALMSEGVDLFTPRIPQSGGSKIVCASNREVQCRFM